MTYLPEFDKPRVSRCRDIGSLEYFASNSKSRRFKKKLDLGSNSLRIKVTGSSAKKLKAGGANLLAGRASLRFLFPILFREAGNKFDTENALRWGSLPKIFALDKPEEKDDFLRSYALAYIKEEIWAEQLVRNIDPFRKFLEIAASLSGKILNFTNIARDTGVDTKTIQSWYSLLEDTLIGFHLEAYHSSVRKQIRHAPKFYFFDIGVTRALSLMLNVLPSPKISYYGDLFEQLVLCEMMSRNQYENLDYRFHYLMTKSGAEVDLILKRPGKKPVFIKIKSAVELKEIHFHSLKLFSKSYPDAEFMLWSQDPTPQKYENISALHWKDGIYSV